MAKCIHEIPNDSRIEVVAPSDYVPSFIKQTRLVNRIIIDHSRSFNDDVGDNELAVLRLFHEFSYSNYIQPIIAEDTIDLNITEGTNVYFHGWIGLETSTGGIDNAMIVLELIKKCE